MTARATISLRRQAAPRRVVIWMLLALIRFYQVLRAGHVSPCRFTPTCSQYALDALSHHGLRRGLSLAVRRLGRCHPWGHFGSDPVPE